jgi:hypothetical protein
VIAHNSISGFEADGVSLRSDNALVTDNTISGGGIGIAYFDYDTRSGTTQLLDNSISNVQTAFFFSGESYAVTGGRPIENFVIRHNVFEPIGNTAIDITGGRFSRIDVSQNVLRGSFAIAVAADSPTDGGRYTERQNIIFGNGVFNWNSKEMPYPDYRASTGLGVGDHIHPLPSS